MVDRLREEERERVSDLPRNVLQTTAYDLGLQLAQC